MRVVQLIDSLEAGGAERMAVNIANGLCDEALFSALVTTRIEGALKSNIHKNVSYSFLEKKRILDVKSIKKFRNFLIDNKIDIVHAHGTSYFYAVLTKIILPKIKIFWHDHNGNRESEKKSNIVLKLFSFFFDGVFTVNEELKNWAEKELLCKNIHFIPNFAVKNSKASTTTFLKGETGKRMICLANLRNPKNHMELLKSFAESDAIENNWSLHLIGNDKNDDYSNNLKKFVKNHNLENYIFFYGSCNDINEILIQGNIGVLSSTHEGFPVTLLEYGMAKLSVISTNVGYCKSVIKNNVTGLLFDPANKTELTNCINNSVRNFVLTERLSTNLHTFVNENYSQKSVIEMIMINYKKSFEK